MVLCHIDLCHFLLVLCSNDVTIIAPFLIIATYSIPDCTACDLKKPFSIDATLKCYPLHAFRFLC